jgi:hypothetical protein
MLNPEQENELLNRIVREDFGDEPEDDPYEEHGNPVGELPIPRWETVGKWDGPLNDQRLVWQITDKASGKTYEVRDFDLRHWCYCNMPYPTNHVGTCVRGMHTNAYADAHWGAAK